MQITHNLKQKKLKKHSVKTGFNFHKRIKTLLKIINLKVLDNKKATISATNAQIPLPYDRNDKHTMKTQDLYSRNSRKIYNHF